MAFYKFLSIYLSGGPRIEVEMGAKVGKKA